MYFHVIEIHVLSFAKEGPDYRESVHYQLKRNRICTMNVAALATSEPHVSTIISKLNAFVPTSIPLFTKIRSGRLSRLRTGRNALSKPLVLHSDQPHVDDLVAHLRNCVGMAKSRTSMLSMNSLFGNSGPIALMFVGKAWSGRYTGFRLCSLKCLTIRSSRAHM